MWELEKDLDKSFRNSDKDNPVKLIPQQKFIQVTNFISKLKDKFQSETGDTLFQFSFWTL